MRVNTLIVDDFYNNPIEVRDFALSQDFGVDGNYPGHRTTSHLNEDLKETLQELLKPFAGEVTNWGGEYSGSFQYTTSDDRSWIHSDSTTGWAAVLYLTPNAPVTSGTGLFKHRDTGLCGWDNNLHSEEETALAPHMTVANDYTKWDLVDRLGNKFNRLVLYRSDNYHVSMDYFGSDKYDGRLFQVFFFTTEF
jgi:hypothetical protein|tara:strand:- start:1671 stop:2249 length:579 start_codon:yes stop_codon:yes gene_type:complete